LRTSRERIKFSFFFIFLKDGERLRRMESEKDSKGCDRNGNEGIRYKKGFVGYSHVSGNFVHCVYADVFDTRRCCGFHASVAARYRSRVCPPHKIYLWTG
jgi:hypothetical protein